MLSPARNMGRVARPEPGMLLGKYRVVRLLGAGGMGTVYEALHVEIGKPVALKVLSADLASDPRAHSRFLQEAAAVSRLRHPHVVNVTDYGTHEGVPYIVMELLRGEDLADYLEHHALRLPIEAAVDILLAICAGVSAAHHASITHRDLKPRNIFLDRSAIRERDPKVLDFGISKVEDDKLAESLTDTGAVMGTVNYMSPEQVLGKSLDSRTDQYSLGVVLYECLTGRRPHEGDTIFTVIRSIGEGSFVPPSKLRPDVPPALEAAILRAMALDAAARFATVHAFGAALLPFASSRKRMHWTDYYTRDPLEASLAGGEGDPAPPPPGHLGHLPRTIKLPDNVRASPPPTVRLLTEEASASPSMADERGGSRTGSAQPEHTSPGRPRWPRPAIAMGLLACLGAGLLVWWGQGGPRWRTNGESTTIPVYAPPTKRTDPPPPLDEVTVAVGDGPPGLVASVDGTEVGLPLRLPRGPTPRVVVFRAPGYKPKEMTIDAQEDKTVRVELRKQPVDEGARARAEPKKGSKKQTRPASNGDRRSDAPPPFKDF